MPDLFNSKDLKDKQIQPYKKTQSSIYLTKQTYQKIDSIKTLDELSSRNEVIEKAIDFYFAFISSQLSQDFLCGVYGQKVEGTINILGNRIAKLQFKNAVEMDILTLLLSNVLDISKKDYDKLRSKAVESVKKNNGIINIVDAANGKER